MKTIKTYLLGGLVGIFALTGIVAGSANITSFSDTINEGDTMSVSWFRLVSQRLGGTMTDGKMCTFSSGKISCLNDVPVNIETKLGTMNEGKWCTAQSGKIVCNQDAPSGGTSFESDIRSGVSRITGMIPGQKYLVSVYGNAQDDGGITIRGCVGSTNLATTGSYGHTGRLGTEGAVLLVTAPSDGCIAGFTRGNGYLPAKHMLAWSINGNFTATGGGGSSSGGGGGGGGGGDPTYPELQR